MVGFSILGSPAQGGPHEELGHVEVVRKPGNRAESVQGAGLEWVQPQCAQEPPLGFVDSLIRHSDPGPDLFVMINEYAVLGVVSPKHRDAPVKRMRGNELLDLMVEPALLCTGPIDVS